MYAIPLGKNPMRIICGVYQDDPKDQIEMKT